MIDVRTISGADWQSLRDLRLQALADSPNAFGETYADAAGQSDEQWRARAARNELPGHTAFAALDDGRWVGTMRVAVEDGWAMVMSVFVLPEHRGRPHGVADALLDQVEQWARAQDVDGLRLDVHEDNARAQRFYLRRGFRPTGVRKPFDLDPTESEIEMARRWPDADPGTEV